MYVRIKGNKIEGKWKNRRGLTERRMKEWKKLELKNEMGGE